MTFSFGFQIPALRGLALLALLIAPASTWAAWLSVPIRIDNPFLVHLLESRVYTGSDGVAEVWNDGSGCNYLRLTDPRVFSRGGTMVVLSNGEGRIGSRIGDSCLLLQNWTGTIEIIQKPVLNADRRRLVFEVLDSAIYEADGLTGIRNETVWQWVKQYAHPLIRSIDVDLNEAVAEMENILPLFLPGSDFVRVQRLLDSMYLEKPGVVPAGIEASLRFELLDPLRLPAPVPEPVLSPEELKLWEQRWQTWDAFITLLVTRIAESADSEQVNDVLLDVLLTARYELAAVLAGPVSRDPDPVRALFVKSWRRLKPMIRRLSDQLPGAEALRFLGLITAADALEALDEVGPGLGLEISVSGLRRMARLIAPQEADSLKYQRDVDPEIRRLFDFKTSLPDPDDATDEADDATSPEALLDFLISPSRALNLDGRLLAVILNHWVPTQRNIREYIPKANSLLLDIADHVTEQGKLADSYRTMFQDMVRATAWKESCWRQYSMVDGKVDALRSTAGAVGIMQVLPTVWHGFYDVDQLESSIAYNATAGAEILLRYLTRYALKRNEQQHPGGVDNLVRATYAAYNGGPSHLARYRRGDTPASLKIIDKSFFEKYRAISKGNIEAVAACYPRPGIKPRAS